MSSITDGASFNSTSAYYATSSGGGGGGGVVIGSGQNTTGTRTATFWEVGELLFCHVLISTAGGGGYPLGTGAFTLPTGYAWTTNTQAGFPVVICSALSNTSPGVSFPYIANGQINQPTSGVNQVITVQCVGGDPTQPNFNWQGVSANINVLAFGQKAVPP